MAAAEIQQDPSPLEVVPLAVLSGSFPARPSFIPSISSFVRRCLAESPLTEDGNREISDVVFGAVLDAAGGTGSIQVAFRIFPEHVEADVLHSATELTRNDEARVGDGRPPLNGGESGWADGGGRRPAAVRLAQALAPTAAGLSDPARPATAQPGQPGQPGDPASFAEWMTIALRSAGMTQQAAAWQLGVSVKTVGRWVGGATEPRMRDLRRIREMFGEVPLP